MRSLLYTLYSGNSFFKKSNKLKLTGKLREIVYEQLASFIEDGFTPYTAASLLAFEYKSLKGDKRAEVYFYMAKRLGSGDELSAIFDGIVDASDIHVIHAAEESGEIAQGFRTLLYFTEQKRILASSFKALIKPILMGCAALAILHGFATILFPQFAADVDPQKWSFSSRSLYATGQFLDKNILLIVFSLIAYSILSFMMLPTLTGPFRDRFLNRFLPPWNVYRIFATNSFLVTISTVMSSGQKLQDALEVTRDLSPRYLRWHIDVMQARLSNGVADGHALSTDLFPIETQILLRTYGSTSSFDEAIGKIARRSLESAVRNAQSTAEKANNVLKVVIGGVLMWIITAMAGVMLPLMDTMSF